MNKEKLLGFFGLFLLITPFTFIIIEYWNISSLNSWGASEWLISYSGGFVRRGLGGELIYNISSYFLISPSKIVVLFSFLSYLLLSAILIKVSKNIIPIYILFSPLILGMPIYSNFLIRKDVFGVLCLLLTLLLIKEKLNIKTIFLTNFLCIIAILNHEAFIFFGLPIIILTLNLLNKNKILSIIGLIKIFPSLVISIFVVFFHGTPEISKNILASWNVFISNNFIECCYLKKDFAIDSIGHGIEGPMGLAKTVLGHWSVGILYVPLMWLLTWFVSMIAIGQVGIHNTSIRKNFYLVAIAQTIFIFPLFLLGWDFGRWLFYIFVSSVSWVLVFQDKFFKIPLKKFNTVKENNIIVIIFLLFFSVPSCCWTLQKYFKNTAFFSNYGKISYIITGYNLKTQYQFIKNKFIIMK